MEIIHSFASDMICPKRLVLTHMSADMLDRADPIQHERAEDGMVLMLEG